MTRASTMLLAMLILNVLLGGLSLTVAHSERRSRALRLWGWGLLLYSVGLLITIPESLPFDLRKVIGNALIAYAPILSVDGALSHTRFRLRRQWTTLAFLASIAPIVWNHVNGHYNVLVDILSPAPIANVLFGVAAFQLWRTPPSSTRIASRFVAVTFATSVLVWTVRMYALWTSIGGSNDRDRADLIVALFAIAQVVNAVAATLGLHWIEVRKMESELRELADTDALTGLPNRRATLARFEIEAAHAARLGNRLGLAIFDVDHFKRINDHHGHLVGDLALQHIAQVLGREVRRTDLVGRIGGEEFVALLTEDQEPGAQAAADRLREALAAAPLQSGKLELPLTLSGGLAHFPTEGETWDALFALADQRLYAAKSGGRNRVVG